ncbi:hypothetical protein [Arcobacter sp.]|uniref:hypothetical protein n=1 Tax=Arcobacter sp. TaxID=1872629 RepID=UPI003D09A958
MKELIEKIENREEFFLKILKKFLRKNVNDLQINEIKSKNITYVFLFSAENQTVIIDGVFNDGLNPILNAETLVKKINKKLNLNHEEMLNIAYIGSYVDNLNYLNLREFKFKSFKNLNPSGIDFNRIMKLSKIQVEKIIKGEKNV